MGYCPLAGVRNITGESRASAVLILNDPATGYPIACLESSIISAVRTAASAALAADRLAAARGGARPRRLGFVGAGLIARFAHTYLTGNGWEFDEIGVHDLLDEHSAGLASYLRRADSAPVRVHNSAESLIKDADLIVFATVAGEPHVEEPSWFAHGTLFDVLAGKAAVPADQPVVFSPFGLGVLDLGVGRFVYDRVVAAGQLDVVEDFYAELERYG
ncbi:hypothetical protein [Micromonospora rubida]|uniref:hypothetical protein n=1 Tax=Micromonospora rubida TaxID=2697657 RepID=UPI0022A77CA8|nr:hypothetical protein [Micromonospora rubida]